MARSTPRPCSGCSRGRVRTKPAAYPYGAVSSFWVEETGPNDQYILREEGGSRIKLH